MRQHQNKLGRPRSRLLMLRLSLVAGICAAVTASADERMQIDGTTLAGVLRSAANEHDLGNTFSAIEMILEGREIFRFDTFGDEAFWGGALRLHEAIAGEANGGTGPGLAPSTALDIGLKVDAGALPPPLRAALRRGDVDLEDPASTLALLQHDAVVGVRGFFAEDGTTLTSVGITCALCHSTVDDSLAPSIGQRLDGWAARDLDVGAIIALAPNLQPFVDLLAPLDGSITESDVREVLHSWGPGKFDASLLIDGIAFQPDGTSAATLIPPAFGLAGVNLSTWTGWGSLTYWNAFVANLKMGGQGVFIDERLNDSAQFPVAAFAGLGEVRNDPDLVTPKLANLHLYQLSIPAPPAPQGSYDEVAAARGEALFSGKAECAQCHVPPLYTEPGWNLRRAEEIGIDDFQASRSPEERYRTAPLRGLWTHTTGGFYHDGRFASLLDVVEHYDEARFLGLSEQEKDELVEYLKSL